MPRTFTVTAQDPQTGKEFDVDLEWNGEGEPDPASVQQAVHQALANQGHVAPPSTPAPAPSSFLDQAGQAAAGYAGGVASTAIPNPVEIAKAQPAAIAAPVKAALGQTVGPIERAGQALGIPGGGVLDQVSGALRVLSPFALAGQADPTGVIEGILAGALGGGQEAAQGIQQGNPRQAGHGVGAIVGATLPNLVGVEGGVPGVSRAAQAIEAAAAPTLQSVIGKLKARAGAGSAKSAGSGRPPAAPESVPGAASGSPTAESAIVQPGAGLPGATPTPAAPRSAGPTAGSEVTSQPGPSGVRGEPPVPAGHVRLYRGEGTEGQLGGRFYTRDPRLALAYSEGPAAGTPGEGHAPAKARYLTYVDVPEGELPKLERPPQTAAAPPGSPDSAPGEYVVPPALEGRVRAVPLPKAVPPKPPRSAAQIEADMGTHVDAFLDDIAKSTGSLEEAGKARGEALAAREKQLRDAFSKDYEDVYRIADEAGARPKTERIVDFIANLNPAERTKLKGLGVDLVGREVGDAVVEPPVDLSFREMHDLRSRALREARALKSGPPDPSIGAVKKVASLAKAALNEAASSSPSLSDIWQHVDGQYEKTFGSKGEFYGTVLKKIAKTNLDKGVPPEKSHRLLFGASLEDVRALKAHLPEMDVRRMFRDALQEALTNPDGSLLDPNKMLNRLRSKNVFGKDVIAEGLGQRHAEALDRLVSTLKSKKIDANQAAAQLEQRAAALSEQRSLQSKLRTVEEKRKARAAAKEEAARKRQQIEAEKEAKTNARFQSLEQKIAEGDKKLAGQIASYTIPGNLYRGARLFFQVMSHPKTAYAFARVLEESQNGVLPRTGLWAAKLDQGLREVVRERDEENKKGPGKQE